MSEVIKRPRGAPTKRTPETATRLCEAVARGLPFTYACRVAGISYSTFCAWRNEDKELDDQLELAVASAVEKRLAVIEKAADLGDTGCARWLLEHLHPQFFARNRIEITGADGAPLAAGIQLYLPKKQLPAVEIEAPKALEAPANGQAH